MSKLSEIKLEKSYVMPTFARYEVDFVRGEGMHLFDDTGKDYLDFLSGIGVCSVGHCNRSVTSAIKAQADKLMHVSNYYYIEGRGELSKKVSDILNELEPGKHAENWKMFYTNSGAESNECAMKLARLYAKKKMSSSFDAARYAPRKILVLEHSFHGRTMETLAATAQSVKQEAFFPLDKDFVKVPINDLQALELAFEENGNQICAAMIEVIQGESGIHECSAEFLKKLRELCTNNDALLICDEVQSGIFRCGKYGFAFQHFGIRPDIVTIAKGIGNGFPMGICAAISSVADVFEPGLHGTTFGGSALAVAAASAVLSVIEEKNIAENVSVVGDYFAEKLKSIPNITEVRGLGLMRGADISDDLDAHVVVAKCLDKGLVINATGEQTLRFLPPLICASDDVDDAVEILTQVLTL